MVEPAASYNDDHPPHHPMLGQMFIGSIHNAMAGSPQWNRCLGVLYYDEGGGFFDHVVPPTTADDREGEGFEQLGFRVPAILWGPYVRQGHVSNVAFDHTSPLAHIIGMFGLEPLTARDAAASDLWEAVDEDRLAAGDARDPASLPILTVSEAEVLAECDAAAESGIPGQPELAAALRAPGCVALARRRDLGRTGRFLLEQAVELGVCVVDS
jgi:phospholipase C